MRFDFKVDPSKESKLLNIAFFIGVYVLAIYGGLWWLDGDLIRGIVFILGLCVLSMHMGMNNRFNQSKVYIVLAYIFPPALGTILFLLGFL